VADDGAREIWEKDLVLIRPDQHVAWRGNACPARPEEVVRRVRGMPSMTLSTTGRTGHDDRITHA
jgi:hypothetical protein